MLSNLSTFFYVVPAPIVITISNKIKTYKIQERLPNANWDGNGRFILSEQIMASNHSLTIEEAERLPTGLYCTGVLSRGKQVYKQTVVKE